MRLFFLLSLCIFLSSPKHAFRITVGDDKCKTVLDSAKVLVQYGEFSINWETRSVDRQRAIALSDWMEKRSFAELTCLLKSNNKLYQFYGYTTASLMYPDSLGNAYSQLLDDTTSLQYNTEKGLVDTKMTLGAVTKIMAAKMAEVHANINRKPEAEAIVTSFIKEFAGYPDSYKPISFPGFSVGSSTEESLTDFKIWHEYEIRSNKKEIVKVTSVFVLDPQMRIQTILQDSTSYIIYPSKTGDWLRDYGKKLNHDDSVKLRLR